MSLFTTFIYKILARFIWWSVYSTVAPLTMQQFRDLGFRFSQKVFGLKEKTPRWKGCTGNVNANFGMALSYIYMKKHFNEQAKEKVHIICRQNLLFLLSLIR